MLNFNEIFVILWLCVCRYREVQCCTDIFSSAVTSNDTVGCYNQCTSGEHYYGIYL